MTDDERLERAASIVRLVATVLEATDAAREPEAVERVRGELDRYGAASSGEALALAYIERRQAVRRAVRWSVSTAIVLWTLALETCRALS